MITKLKNPTIDVKYITSLEYVQDNSRFHKHSFFIILFLSILLIIAIWITFIKTTNADNTTITDNVPIKVDSNYNFLQKFPDEHTVIWCYNDRSKTTREASICTMWWDHNIILPPKKHIKKWLTVFNEKETVNRLALVNFESSFKENAENKYAKWYVQTLKKWKIKPEIIPQLEWMKNRQKYQKVKISSSGSKRCWYYWDNYNYKDWFPAWEYWVLACLYRYHYNANTWTWYAKRWILTTKFYKNYLQNK
jgi:hypothetical protein